MDILGELAIGFVCVSGGIYSFYLLRDSILKRRSEPDRVEGAGRGQGTRRLTPRRYIEQYSQAVAAGGFLVVVATVVTTSWDDSRLLKQVTSNDESKASCPTEYVDSIPVPSIRITRDITQTRRPILGADLAYLPITDDNLGTLAKEGDSIRFLTLTSTCVTDRGLFCLRELSQLRDISLGRTSISDAGCKELGKIRSLETLALNATNVGDAGIEHLSRLSDLKYLDIRNTRVTDACIPEILKLRRLESLRVDGTRISEAGTELLREHIDVVGDIVHD